MKTPVCMMLLLALFAAAGNAQTLNDFKYLGDKYGGEDYLGVSACRTSLRNSAAPRPDVHHKSAFLVEFEYDVIGFNKGNLNYSCDYKLITDLLFITSEMVNRKSNGLRDESSAIGCGVIGWHSLGWNMIARPKHCIAPGFTINDYFVGASYYDEGSGGLVSPEPQGWYLASGPALFTHHYINTFFLLHTHASYNLAYARPVSLTYGIVNDAYPKPHFMHLNATLMTRWGLFAELQFSRLINRGTLPNRTQRLDLKTGFAFVF